MLRELLALVAAGGAATREGMAEALGASGAEIDDMLDRLASLGYIEDLGSRGVAGDSSTGKGKACADYTACGSCAACGKGCFPDSQARLLSLSEKGRKALKERSWRE